MALSLRYGAVSDIGRARKKNDDSGYAGPRLVMVADGMGGAPAGDLASAVAIQTLQGLDAAAPDDLLEALAGAVRRANDRLTELIDDDAAVDGMGTTVSAVLFDGARIGVAHLGDSRGYLWRDGELLRITRDHTWVQSLIDEGRISEEESKVHAHRSLLLKVLDGRHDNAPDLTVYDVQAGDRILLCSDGLSGFVDHDRLERVLSIGTAESVAAELVQLALEAASTDNVTVIVADVVDEPADEGAAPLIVGAAADHPRGPMRRLRTWAHRGEAEPGETLMTDPDIDPEELRYAPRAPGRFRWLVRGLVLLVVAAAIGLGGKLSYDWSQRQYYVAPDGDQVAIYQGVQADLPGISLHHVYQTDVLSLDQLPSFRRSQVLEGMVAEDLDDARAIVDRLHNIASACTQRSASSASTTPRPTRPTETTPPRNNDQTRRPPETTRPRPAQTTRPRAAPDTAPGRTSRTPQSPGRTSRTPQPPGRTTRTPQSPRSAESATTSDTSTGSTAIGTGGAGGGPEECSGATPVSESTR